MKKLFACLLAVVLVIGIMETANSALFDRGGGLIYDDVLNITWLQDANYAITSGYTSTLGHGDNDESYRMDWYEAMAWAGQLEYMGYDDWRLPTAETRIDPISNVYPDGTEMGHLYHIDLGNYGSSVFHSGPFLNLDYGSYWLSTETAGGDPPGYYAKVFVVNLFTEGPPVGMIMDSAKNNLIGRAWPVRDGDVVPIPSAIWLLGSALVGLVGLRKKFMRK